MEEVQAHFKKKFDKTGIALTIAQLVAFAKEKKLVGVSRVKVGEFLASQKDLAQFAPVPKTKVYQSQSVVYFYPVLGAKAPKTG